MGHRIQATPSRMAFLALCVFGALTVRAETQIAGQAPAPMAKTPAAQDVFPADVKRQIWFRHLKALPADLKTAGLHMEVEDAPVLSSRITALFSQAGYTMVPPEQAAHRYLLRGSFQSDGKIKMTLPVGKALEAAVTASKLQGAEGTDSSGLKRAGDVAFAGVLADQALKAGLTSPLWASGDLINAVLSATGIRDSINTALTGDRRGICLIGCTYWEWTEQRVSLSWNDPRISDARSASVVDVGVFAKGLFLEELATLALNEFLRHHGVVQTPEPATDAQMPLDQFMKVATGRSRATIKMLEP